MHTHICSPADVVWSFLVVFHFLVLVYCYCYKMYDQHQHIVDQFDQHDNNPHNLKRVFVYEKLVQHTVGETTKEFLGEYYAILEQYMQFWYI